MRTLSSFFTVLATLGTIGVAATVSGCDDSRQSDNLLVNPGSSMVRESPTHTVGSGIAVTGTPLSSPFGKRAAGDTIVQPPAPLPISIHITSPPQDASTIVTATHIVAGPDMSKYESEHHSSIPEFYTQRIKVIWTPIAVSDTVVTGGTR